MYVLRGVCGVSCMISIVQKLLSTIDVSRLLLAGHSFGAATAIQIAQSENAALKGAFKACLLYDPWTEPIPDAALQKGIDLPTLTMTSGWSSPPSPRQLFHVCFCPLTFAGRFEAHFKASLCVCLPVPVPRVFSVCAKAHS